MARKCTICTHPDRESIDRAIVDGEANRAIARQFRVSKDAVARHAENHLPVVLVEARQDVKLAHANDLWGRIDALIAEAEDLLSHGRRTSDARAWPPESVRPEHVWSSS